MKTREIIMLFLVCVLIAIIVNTIIKEKTPNMYETECLEWIEEIKASEESKEKCKLVGTITEAIMKQDLKVCDKVKEKEICKEYAQNETFDAREIITL